MFVAGEIKQKLLSKFSECVLLTNYCPLVAMFYDLTLKKFINEYVQHFCYDKLQFTFFREESFFVLGCVLAISLLLSGMEVVWGMQVQMDQFYYVIFWLQSFFIVLPFGMIGRHFLEF